ncbi:4Fe-4S binding protein [Thermodesulfobacteriota bacterium]
MAEEIYRKLRETMARPGDRYPGLDIPEFYSLVEELFTPEEAEVFNTLPRGFNPPDVIANESGLSEEKVSSILEGMADKGLCMSIRKGDITVYCRLLFMPGIMEYQLMRGTSTERDKRLAGLIFAYKKAYDRVKGPQKEAYPTSRVITVDRVIQADNAVHTYDQVASYLEKYEPISVSTCYCRHGARLLDEQDHCGKPDEVCMQFGTGASYVIDRGMGRKVTKEEALDILKLAEEEGLVHVSINRQEIDFICNCCSCHCVALKAANAQSRPGEVLNSGFYPQWDPELCTACDICIDRCPMSALTSREESTPEVDMDRCIGCGVCATGCPEEAIALEPRPGSLVPPVDQKALKAAIQAAHEGS